MGLVHWPGSATRVTSCLVALVKAGDLVQRNRKMVGRFFAREVSPKWGVYLNLLYGSSSFASNSAVYMREVSDGEKESEYRKSGI
jgi:hypothetical protein